MASDTRPPVPRVAARKLASRLAGINVLIADPDAMIADLVRAVLKTVGFTNVRIVRSGTEALQILNSEKIDLMITDWRMDKIDGVSLMRYLRASPQSPNRFLPIIMLTGRAEVRDVQEARDAGVTEYVVKPFAARTLFERIVQVIDNPRSFILAKGYKGPDRRRRSSMDDSTQERRQRRVKAQPKPPVVA
jgi:two-component system chemotaxis response regulator CheY